MLGMIEGFAKENLEVTETLTKGRYTKVKGHSKT